MRRKRVACLAVPACLLVCLVATHGVASGPVAHKAGEYFSSFEAEPYLMVEDFGFEPLWDCALQYYYYIPCPTYSWFWGYSGWKPGDMLGAIFTIGDYPTGGYCPCDPMTCHCIEWIRVLDFAGYGTTYPGFFTVDMDMYCCDANSYPCFHLWNGNNTETHFGWNYIHVDPPVRITPCVSECSTWDWSHPSLAVTMTMVGVEGIYPSVGFDNISSPLRAGCLMHDYSCLPAVYPRTWAGGRGARVHSGYVGSYAFQYWPPLPLFDGLPYNPDVGDRYGFVEAAWRMYFICGGPTLLDTDTQPTTWGAIKSMYE
jgi:hypothetical protein